VVYLLPAELWSHFWPNSDCRDLMRFGGVLADCCVFWRRVFAVLFCSGVNYGRKTICLG